MLKPGIIAAAVLSLLGVAQTTDVVRLQVQRERQPLLDTLRTLVEIESGSGDMEGIARIGAVIGDRLRGLGGAVESVPPAADMPRFLNTPAQVGHTIVARFRGRGTKRILLLAHMDTVYQRGQLGQQPFRIEGDRAYGLGIADDKQGVAIILHAISALRTLGFDRYGLITVLISPDEEVGSVAERSLITELGAQHDVVFSCEGAGVDDNIRLATSGVEIAQLTVKGRASHAGVAPEQGRNALYELSHQILQMRDLSDPAKAVKVNWTMADAGSVLNMIPENARALADMRADDSAEFKAVEARIRERIKTQLIAGTSVEVRFEDMFPPLPFRPQSLGVAEHAARVYAEVGGTAKINRVSIGGGTDAAFAARGNSVPVLEGFGLRTFGAHSSNAEYVEVTSIEPRLYLLTRMIMDVADGKI